MRKRKFPCRKLPTAPGAELPLRPCLSQGLSLRPTGRYPVSQRGLKMTLDDGLDLLTNLLTLAAIALVALEKARPDQHERRKKSLERFVQVSVFASSDRIRRRVAMMMARTLKGSDRAGMVVGFLGAPLNHLLKKQPKIQNLLLLLMLGMQLTFAVLKGSIWLFWILPGFALGILSIVVFFPMAFILFSGSTLTDNLDAGQTHMRRGNVYVFMDIDHVVVRWWLKAASLFYPDIIRVGGRLAFNYRFTILPVNIALMLVVAGLVPIPLTLIDGFLLSPPPAQAITVVVGSAVIVVPALVFVMVPILAFQQQFFSAMSPRQIGWAGHHVLRAWGPSAAISATASLGYALASRAFDVQGGGWFVFANLSMDIWLAALTGIFVREVIRRRGDTVATLRAMAWVVVLVAVMAGAKLALSTLLMPMPLGIAESYRIASGLDILQHGHRAQIGLFLVSQTASLYWLFYGITLLVMLSLSGLARVIESAFGLALSTVSPLEILATYLTFVAGLAALGKSLIKIVG